ncbi:MarR family winged helix-turn-helix transcriptional regulator [Nocardia sp. NPDC059180]|uniref:MarR family winged helix-turn-helix transcriptional regulator n=1 Tax=Nocardia sp. NPDC059180 TaxID=3346761 RepID=UPI0036ACD41B
MNDVSDVDPGQHRRSPGAVREALRELNTQLSLLNRQYGTTMTLNVADWNCLDLIDRYQPIGPGDLARRAGMHPATMTGILDRLQRNGWIVRERDPEATDRRAVTLRTTRDHNPDVYRMLSGMNTRIEQICRGYSATELELIADFLRRVAAAGHESATELSGQ